jgi:hypothetical protein
MLPCFWGSKQMIECSTIPRAFIVKYYNAVNFLSVDIFIFFYIHYFVRFLKIHSINTVIRFSYFQIKKAFFFMLSTLDIPWIEKFKHRGSPLIWGLKMLNIDNLIFLYIHCLLFRIHSINTVSDFLLSIFQKSNLFTYCLSYQ